MGIPSGIRNDWTIKRRESLLIASPAEDAKIREEAIRDALREGAKGAAIASVVSAVPTLVAVRTIPWAKANINHTGQALIIGSVSVAAFYITGEKTLMRRDKRNAHYDRSA